MDKSFVASNGTCYRCIVFGEDKLSNCVTLIKAQDGEVLGYKIKENLAYFSDRYNKWVLLDKGDKSDGATMAKDVESFGWLLHDDLCAGGVFGDGTPCNNWQGSMILKDVLKLEGFWFRANTWFIATWLRGGGVMRDNGMF